MLEYTALLEEQEKNSVHIKSTKHDFKLQQ